MSYQPIENYGIIGNMRTVALVGREAGAPHPRIIEAWSTTCLSRQRLWFKVLSFWLLSTAPDKRPYFGNCRYIASAEYAYSQEKPQLL